jgi:hypothetical protein
MADGREVPRPAAGNAGVAGLAVFIAAVGFLAFLAGAWVVLDKAGPYPWLRSAHKAGRALYNQLTRFDDPLKTDLWVDARSPARGVTVHDRGSVSPGLTLYTSGHEAAAYLIDLDGKVVHEWRMPFRRVWDETSVVARPRADDFVYFDRAYLYPNGDLLAVYIGVGDTPWGLGLVRLDRDSKVLWKFLDRAHHDVSVGADGRIYTLTHAIRHEPLEGLGHLEPPIIEDFLVILSPDGKVEKKVSLLESILRSPFRRYLHTLPFYTHQDPLHANSADPLHGPGVASIPGAREGDVLLSFRETGLVVVFDPEREKYGWGVRGPWLGQHDPDLLPTGNILLFDNVGELDEDTGRSRVVEFEPDPLRIVWTYKGTRDAPLYSILRSDQQRLPNGNTLITESDAGRMLEVTPDGRIVWEYFNPVRVELNGKERTPVISGGTRYPLDAFEPDFAAILAQ